MYSNFLKPKKPVNCTPTNAANRSLATNNQTACPLQKTQSFHATGLISEH